ncbi:major facilitator superfamily domain-containing protein [Lasiosphaeria miniovina]|uniref:Major facilitator superfamily domain-containing protein n=1 Tax=Lasiosphaeria miniovina TaxID=1954250 RepID=A0AA40B3N3_9PEZI|nr:major facilitator superfamily domain-containing protein [Lasiosphaeria miniovina]KAK0727062.1 major facilitator superfamily domain-containing protein [Lasiosphaeria miniovina]
MAASTAARDASFPDRGPTVFGITTITSLLASAFVLARLVSRIGIVRKVGLDDYIIVLAWLISMFLSATIDIGTKRGLGRHDENIDPKDEPALRMCEYVFSVLYNPALMATKTSILVFYLRLAKNTQRILRLASWAALVIVNTAGTILTFMNIFQCHPVKAAWDIRVQAIRCIPLLTEFICSAPVNVITDLAILALPIPVLTGMQLPSRQKIILVITFAFGIFVTVVDVVRIYYLQQAIAFSPMGASQNPSAIYGQSAGFSWNASLSLMWSAVEVNIGIACACIPTLKPLIMKILPAMILDPHGARTGSAQVPRAHLLGKHITKQDVGEDHQPSAAACSVEPPLVPPVPPLAHVEARISEEVSFGEFLAITSDLEISVTHTSRQHRPSLVPGNGVPPPAAPPNDRSIYFGFVNMARPQSMVRTSATESFKYCVIVVILFFLWGVSYGFLNTLNNAVANVAHMTTAQALGLTSVYFGGGYFFGPLLVGEWLLRHDEHRRIKSDDNRKNPDPVGGFKATFIAGLLIYGTGTIMFWPGAVTTAYGGFMVSSFVVGFGLAVLETAANPFLVLCGPPDYADARLLVASAVTAVGSVLSGLLANKVFFNRIEAREVDSTTLLDVQWTYLAITLLCVLLALFFYYMPLPEVSDKELERLAEQLPVDPNKRSVGGRRLKSWCILLAVTSQWFYVAAQENMSIYSHDLITAFVEPQLSASDYQPPGFILSVWNYLLVAHSAFALSRFTAAYLAFLSARHPTYRFVPTPRTSLTACVVLSGVFMLTAVSMRPTENPNLMAIPVVLFFLAEGPIWPLIFSLGLRGQGSQTKRAAAWLTMGGSGPAFWPFVSYAIQKAGGSIQTSLVIVIGLVAASLAFPLFLTFVKDASAMADYHISSFAEKNRLARRQHTGPAAEGEGDHDFFPQGRERCQGETAEAKESRGWGGLLGKLSRGGMTVWRGFRRKTLAEKVPESFAEGQLPEDEDDESRKDDEAPWECQVLDTSILQR